MEYLQLTNMTGLFIIIIKAFFIGVGLIIFVMSFFHARESRKMEARLKIKLPYYLQTLLSFHMVFSAIFVIAATLLLLF